MSTIMDALLFYENGFDKDGNPKPELLADKGRAARFCIHPSEKGVPPEEAVQKTYMVAAAEISHALGDILQAVMMPPGEARNMKIGSAALKLQQSEFRARMVTRS